MPRRRKQPTRIERLTQSYDFLRRADRSIIGADSVEALFTGICQAAVETGSFCSCWVGQNQSEMAGIVPVAFAGPAAQVEEIRGDYAHTVPHNAPIGKIARHRIGSSLCVPVFVNEGSGYALVLYSNEAEFFTADDISLAEQIGAGLSVALDRITVRRQNQQTELDRLRTHERLELVLGAIDEAYQDWNLVTGECCAGGRGLAILGYESGEFGPDMFASPAVVHPEDTPAVERMRESILNGGNDQAAIEFRARHKRGHFVNVRCRTQVVSRDAAGAPARIVSTLSDISERKQLEAKFLQAQKMESLGRLAGSVAHDFNNHLMVINGYADLIRLKLAPPETIVEPLREIAAAGERASALARHLLAFGRKQEVRRKPLDLGQSVRDMEGMLRRLAGDGVQITFTVQDDLPTITADPTHIEQIVMNLVVNARDAAGEQGRIAIEVNEVLLPEDRLRAPGTGIHVRLAVSDNGCGMDPDVRSHIFEPFFSTKDEAHGTGLGLSTVRTIAQDYDGFVEVRSEPGEGATFEVFLPGVRTAAAASAPLAVDEPPDGGGETILVVDDREELRRAVAQILGHYGYRVLTASGCSDAIALRSGNPERIDLLLTDALMPGASGLELITQFQAVSPETKIICFSGSTEVLSRQLHPDGAGVVFVAKPCLPAVLVSTIRKVLSHESGNSHPQH